MSRSSAVLMCFEIGASALAVCDRLIDELLQRRKRTVTLMAHTVYDAAALRAGSFGIGQINA